MPEENNQTPELNLEEIVEVAPEELSKEQKDFLVENKADLTPEQLEKFSIELIEPVKLDEIEVETRGGKPPEEKPEEKPEEDEEIAPEDEETIGKVVEKRMKPVTEALQQLQKVKDEQEVDSFLRVKPEFGKYREAMIKYVSHPAYSNIPVHNIAAIVASKDLQKMGAEKEREAARRAKETGGGGQTQRKQTGGEVDWSKATSEEFEKKKSEILGQS